MGYLGDVARKVAYVLAISLAFISLPGRAEDANVEAPSKEPVKIESNESVTLDANNDTIVLIGKVKVNYKGDTISADKLTIKGKNFLEAEGNVVLLRDKQELRGEHITYDLKTREGQVSHATAKVNGDGIKGFVYLKGNDVSGGASHYALKGGSLTTCDLDSPHYHIEAKSIEVWPEERIIVRGLSYHEGKVRLIYLPYFVIPLKKENTLTLPKIGYSPTEGIYVKASYNYFFSDSSNGLLRLDWAQRLGVGGGVDHSFKVNKLKSDGLAKVYVLGNKATKHADISGEIKYNQPLPVGWKSSLDIYGATTKPSATAGERIETTGLLSLSKRSTNYSGEFSGNIRNVDYSQDTREIRALTRQTYSISKTLSASLEASYAGQTTFAVDSGLPSNSDVTKQVLTYKGELRDVQPGRTLSLVAQESLNPDRLQTDSVTWTSVAKLPELSGQWDNVLPKIPGNLNLPKVGLTTTLGNYREREFDGTPREGSRADAQLGFRNHNIKLTKSTNVDVTGVGRISAYDKNQRRYAISTGVGIRQNLFAGLSTRVGYSYDDFWGKTPFNFDALSRAETVTGSVDYKAGKASASLGTSYNFASPSMPWGDLSMSGAISPTDKVSLSADARYNLMTEQMKTISGTIKFVPSESLKIDGSAKYDYTKSRFDSFNGKAEAQLPLNIRLGYEGQWDNNLQQFTKNDLSLGYHMHCRELRFSYRQTTKQVWLEYRLDAFPGSDVKVGGSQDSGLMLAVDGLDMLK